MFSARRLATSMQDFSFRQRIRSYGTTSSFDGPKTVGAQNPCFFRCAEKIYGSGVFSARRADISRMPGGWPSLHAGFSRRKCTRASNDGSLLAILELKS